MAENKLRKYEEQVVKNERELRLNAKMWSAATTNMVDLAQELTNKGATLNHLAGAKLRKFSSDQSGPVHIAARKGYIDLLKFLLEDNPEIVNLKNRYKEAPIHWACYYGRVAAVEMLIKHGADIEILDDEGDPPMTWAASTGKINIVDILHSRGAPVTHTNPSGITPLHWAAISGETKMCEHLINLGANPNQKNNSGDTPLDCAIDNGRRDTIALLLETTN